MVAKQQKPCSGGFGVVIPKSAGNMMKKGRSGRRLKSASVCNQFGGIMLFPCLTTAALSFVASVHTPKPSVARARVLAIAELTEVFPAGVHFAATAIPADFLPAGTAPTHKFSDTLMSAVGMYVLLNAGISFLPLIKRRVTLSDGERERAQLEAIQASIQESSFGWHQAECARHASNCPIFLAVAGQPLSRRDQSVDRLCSAPVRAVSARHCRSTKTSTIILSGSIMDARSSFAVSSRRCMTPSTTISSTQRNSPNTTARLCTSALRRNNGVVT